MRGNLSVTRIMLRVIYALIPGVIAYVWFFGWGVIVNMALATAVALLSEAMMLRLRKIALQPFLTDGSAVVTALLLALTLPPLAPWWITVIGTAFAIVVAKHLYGGLGQNPFNPAMIGYAVLLISFPREMTAWLAPQLISSTSLGFLDTFNIIFAGQTLAGHTIDAYTMATPLDTLKTQLGLHKTVDTVINAHAIFSVLGGLGWDWINIGFLLGGLWLLRQRIITWRIPAAMLGGLSVMALIFYGIDPARYASPLFHLFSGATMLGAFFIATDPVSSSTTTRGQVIYGAGIGMLTYIIRTWGGYPDGVAFGVLLMNIAVPMIDMYTQPRVYGHKKK